MSQVQLTVNGKIYAGWEAVRIERGIEQLAGTFELTVSDRWADIEPAKRIPRGAACTVALGGRTVITGFVDTVATRFDAQSHTVTVQGRDKSADLVDCSAIHKSGQWSGKKLEQIAADLLAPFGIGLKAQTDTGAPFAVFSLQEGESVFETLERAARMRAVLLMSDGLGHLVITRAGTNRAPAPLVEGQNIYKAEGEFDQKDRYSDYIVKGQKTGDDHQFGEPVAQQSARIQDASIARYRPLIVLAEDQDATATLAQRAEWERNVRAGRSTRAGVTVLGWDVDGTLWEPNTLTRLQSPLLGADLDLLISALTYVQDESGTLTELQLAPPQAFDLIPLTKLTRLEKKLRKKKAEENLKESITKNPEWEWQL
ncbi:contractile injection system protein, VgrG/Pvc8 family [Methylobacter sp. Wu1]|uniref:phage baseplate assembly protein n=1 Tax=Methylobacter sp. Wu1 TaxID=3119359 RepID=UPI002F9592FC